MKQNFSCKNQEELNELLIIDFADFTQTKLFQVHVHSKKNYICNDTDWRCLKEGNTIRVLNGFSYYCKYIYRATTSNNKSKALKRCLAP